MHIIKLDAIDSTNSYLRQLSVTEAIEDFTVAVANHQTKGRGQMGTQWSSQASKNLMVSVFKDVSFLNLEHHFFISIAVSLSILEALESFNIKNLKVKWPNDILSENKKIGGILIENVIKQAKINATIIGFGVNVNQTEFDHLPQASSMRLISGRVYELEEVLQAILTKLEQYLKMLEQKQFEILKTAYENQLFRKDKPSTFRDTDGHLFSGYIKGVSNSGNLLIMVEDDIIKEFGLKAVTLLY
ncbi:MAG TPA: biotin--[acetyl-CoA-carboxylase] ligase [Flavobacteriaceae bacterium]